MSMRLSNGTVTVRDVQCNSLVDQIDVGAGTAALQVRTGAVGTNPDTASGTLIATFALPSTAFGNSSSGVATAAAITDTTGINGGGTVGHVRVLDKNGHAIWDDDDVGTSGHAINFNTLTVTNGLTVSVTSWTVTQPAT